MSQHLNNTAPRLDKVLPSIPSYLAAITAICLARNPDDRYADMNALINALENPANVDITVLDKLTAPVNSSSMSLTQKQVLQGVLIAVGIIGVLIILSLSLEYLRR
jgi:hypothetical protein